MGISAGDGWTRVSRGRRRVVAGLEPLGSTLLKSWGPEEQLCFSGLFESLFLCFSVPIGRERVVFNGKRVFDPHTIIESFSSLELVGFSGYSASQGLRENAQIEDWKKHDLKCGFFEFGKSKP